MGLKYTIQEETGIVLIDVPEFLSKVDLFEYPKVLFADPHLKLPLREVYDARMTKETDLGLEDFRQITSEMYPFRNMLVGARIALVVDSTFAYGIGRMFEALSESSEFNAMVTKDMDKALAWLSRHR